MMTNFTYMQTFLCALLLAIGCTSAFVVSPPRTMARARLATPQAAASPMSGPTFRRRMAALRASEEETVEAEPQAPIQQGDPATDATKSVRSFFAPNENIRRGASRDQDGKSNVWAVEPKMKVEGSDVEAPEGGSYAATGVILAVFVAAMAATIAFLPSPDSI